MLSPRAVTRLRVHVALTLAIALGTLDACRSEDRRQSAPAARSDTAAKPTVVTLTATDFAFQTPDTLAAGWTTFHLTNNGAQPHMGQLIRLELGMTLQDFLEAYGEALPRQGTSAGMGEAPRWTRRRHSATDE